MTELAENTDLENGDNDQAQDQNQDQEGKQTQNEPEDQAQAAADKAASMGHQSKDDWVNNGGDPFLWQPPEVFLQLKPALTRLKDQGRQIKSLKKENETLTSVYGHQVENLRAQLNQQRDEAVTEADLPKVKQLQQQIDNLPATEQAVANANVALSEELQTWNANPKNDWYRNDKAKQLFADDRFATYKALNYSDTDAISQMDKDVITRFPDLNQNRNNAPPAEGGSKPGKRPGARKLTLNDLNSMEASIWRHRPPNMWKNEAEFLTMVAKTREE